MATKYQIELKDMTDSELEREKVCHKKIIETLEYIYGKSFNSYGLVQRLKKGCNEYAWNVDLYNYLKDNQDYLYNYMKRKDFPNEYNWLKYIGAIIKNYFKEHPPKHEKEIIKINNDFDLFPVRRTTRQKRKSLSEYEKE